ncbi:MAG TPA: hypothetical protein EYP21_01525 [Syntrophaceae bacterium]|nr:hypothetical protein [Syntrophaceae bacterium]
MSLKSKAIALLIPMSLVFSGCMPSQIGRSNKEITQVYTTKVLSEKGDYQLIRVIAPNKFDKFLITKKGEVISEFGSRNLERALESFNLIAE